MSKLSKVVIGIDQSYTRTGITVLQDKQLRECFSISPKGNNSEKRKMIIYDLEKLFRKYSRCNIFVITERIRLKDKKGISESYLKATGALIGRIIDVCQEYNINVYSVDTRSWKSAVVGSSKPMNNPYGIPSEKYRTILYMRDRGLLKYIAEPYKGKSKKGVLMVKIDGHRVPCRINDDIADSYCIAMYGFLSEHKQKLQEETF